jgi:hypothetical protein
MSSAVLSDRLTDDQRSHLGIAARGVLRFALARESPDKYLLSGSIGPVCQTFATNITDSAAVIRELVRPEHLKAHGFAALHWLGRDISSVIAHDPRLAADVYANAFAVRDLSEEQTPLGGALLPMVSTRKQDYDHGLYQLAQAFDGFVGVAPVEATRALIAVVSDWVAKKKAYGGERQDTEVEILGRHFALKGDYSHSWDEGSAYEDQQERRMLDAWERALARSLDAEGGQAALSAAFDVVLAEARTAVIWRRLLKLGAEHAERAGSILKPLVFSTGLLSAMDLEDVAGEFLVAILPALSAEERALVERAILAVPIEIGNARARLLARLPKGTLVTTAAKELAAAQGESVAPRKRRKRVGFSQYVADDEPKEPWANEPQNKIVDEIVDALSAIGAKVRNTTPSAPDLATALDLVRRLSDALAVPAAAALHPDLSRRAWATLADVCAEIAEHGEGPDYEEGIPLLRTCLEKAAEIPDSIADQEVDSDWDNSQFWSATPRRSAAAGLLSLAWHRLDPPLVEMIDRLSRDASKQVRFQVAWRCRTLLKNDAEAFWRLAERFAAEEERPGVLCGLLSGFQKTSGRDPDRAAPIVETIYRRFKEHPKGESAREQCVDIFVGLYVWRGQPTCGAFVRQVASEPGTYPEAAALLPFRLRAALVHGMVEPVDEKAEQVRRRAKDAFCLITRATVTRWSTLVARQSATPPDDKTREQLEQIARLLDQLAMQLYFASGASRRGDSAGEEAPLPRDILRRFYHELGEALDDLARIGLPSIAHHLVQTLEQIVECDPPGVFRRLADVIKAAKQYGYTYESMAAEEMVGLVRRYLAEYRPLLQRDQQSRDALIEVLDAFVLWPEANRLVSRLEEIWR